MRIVCVVPQLYHRNSKIRAVVGHALGAFVEQVIEDKSRLKRAVPGLEPIHMAQLHLITQDVYPAPPAAPRGKPCSMLLVNECRDGQLKYLVHRSAEDEQFALTLRRRAYLLSCISPRRLADIHSMVADSLEVAERVQVLCGALADDRGSAQLSSASSDMCRAYPRSGRPDHPPVRSISFACSSS